MSAAALLYLLLWVALAAACVAILLGLLGRESRALFRSDLARLRRELRGDSARGEAEGELPGEEGEDEWEPEVLNPLECIDPRAVADRRIGALARLRRAWGYGRDSQPSSWGRLLGGLGFVAAIFLSAGRVFLGADGSGTGDSDLALLAGAMFAGAFALLGLGYARDGRWRIRLLRTGVPVEGTVDCVERAPKARTSAAPARARAVYWIIGPADAWFARGRSFPVPKRIASRFAPGAPVTVFVDPRNPERGEIDVLGLLSRE